VMADVSIWPILLQKSVETGQQA